jgi:hypothetical protein
MSEKGVGYLNPSIIPRYSVKEQKNVEESII